MNDLWDFLLSLEVGGREVALVEALRWRAGEQADGAFPAADRPHQSEAVADMLGRIDNGQKGGTSRKPWNGDNAY